MKNFHLPLPDQTYAHLRAEAERAEVPATALAREAIDWWLRQRGGRQDTIGSQPTRLKWRARISTSIPIWRRRESSTS